MKLDSGEFETKVEDGCFGIFTKADDYCSCNGETVWVDVTAYHWLSKADAGLPVEDSLVLEIPSVVTEDNNETTIQQALLDYDVADAINNHNAIRADIVNESILERTGQEVKLRPIQLKNLRIVVV